MSASVTDIAARLVKMAEQRTEETRRLQSGGGGGTSGGMEERVRRLEDDMKALRTDVSYIRGKFDSMPTTLQLLGFVIAIFVAAGVLKYFGH